MKNLMYLVPIFLMSLFAHVSTAVEADDVLSEIEKQENEVMSLQKVGGDYKVEKIEKNPNGFQIHFSSIQKTGTADRIVLQSDHVHFGLDVGSEVRLSADVRSISDDNTIVEAYQVLLYLPAPEGFLPVWLLSSKSRGFEKGSVNYLKMHAPQSDFMVF